MYKYNKLLQRLQNVGEDDHNGESHDFSLTTVPS